MRDAFAVFSIVTLFSKYSPYITRPSNTQALGIVGSKPASNNPVCHPAWVKLALTLTTRASPTPSSLLSEISFLADDPDNIFALKSSTTAWSTSKTLSKIETYAAKWRTSVSTIFFLRLLTHEHTNAEDKIRIPECWSRKERPHSFD